MSSMTPLPFPFETVDRQHRPTVGEFEQQTRQHPLPVVLTGCLDDWPVAEELRQGKRPLDTLSTRIGKARVRFSRVAADQNGQFGYTDNGSGVNFRFQAHPKPVPFAEFAAELDRTASSPGTGTVYMQSAALGQFPALAADAPALPYFRNGYGGDRRLWVGSGGQVVNLHFDPVHNFVAMLNGRKRVTLIPPGSIHSMDPAPLDCRIGDAIGSRIRLLDYSESRHPAVSAKMSLARVADLGPGEVLYIPPLWWHHVESFGLNVMINDWIPPIPGDQFFELTVSLVQGIAAFHACSPAERHRYHRYYSSAVFAESGDEIPAGTPKRIASHIAQTRGAVADLPEYLEPGIVDLFDYYVFRTNGEPSLSLEGADAFVARVNSYSRWIPLVRVFKKALGRVCRD